MRRVPAGDRTAVVVDAVEQPKQPAAEGSQGLPHTLSRRRTPTAAGVRRRKKVCCQLLDLVASLSPSHAYGVTSHVAVGKAPVVVAAKATSARLVAVSGVRPVRVVAVGEARFARLVAGRRGRARFGLPWIGGPRPVRLVLSGRARPVRLVVGRRRDKWLLSRQFDATSGSGARPRSTCRGKKTRQVALVA